jgi:hypothetical protein
MNKMSFFNKILKLFGGSNAETQETVAVEITPVVEPTPVVEEKPKTTRTRKPRTTSGEAPKKAPRKRKPKSE